MTPPLPLPQAIQNILTAALEAVDPYRAVKQALEAADGAPRRALDAARQVVVLALGKAAAPMARAAHDVLGSRISRGLIVTKSGHESGAPPGFRIIIGGHPVPNEGSQRGGAALLHAVRGLTADDVVLLLLSGGGSALAVAPRLPLTLTDLQHTNRLLLASGAPIGEINAVRKHLDALKGGGLARAAAPATVAGLVLSDVLGDPLDVIASGPAVPDPTTFLDAWNVLVRYALLDRVPSRVREVLQRGMAGEIPETPKPHEPFFEGVHHRIVGSVVQAAEAAAAAAQAQGFHSAVAATTLQGEAREVGKALAAMLREMATRDRPLPRPACLVAFATDGADGPTDAAGAFATGETLAQARTLGLSPAEFLRRHDAYTFWEAAGGLLRTGPTQTNVNDLILLVTLPNATGEQSNP